jgi:hypothetical protein
MNKIYGKDTDNKALEGVLKRMEAHNIEDKFVDEVCNQITEILGISYQDRKIFKAVLKKAIGKDIDSVNNYDGLLQQHGAYVLDKSSKRLIDELELGDVRVNHEYAAHAKFADIVKAIKTKLDESSIKVKELGSEEFAEKLLERYGPEAIFKLAQLLIKIANDDVNLALEDVSKPMSVDYRDERIRQKPTNDNPPNIMQIVATYKVRIKELQDKSVTSILEHNGISVEIKTLEGVVANLSSWIVHNY